MRIHPEIADLAVPVDSLNRYYKNPRRGDVPLLQESLRENGQYKALVVNTGDKTNRPREILTGNHTWDAAVAEGWDEIAVTWVNADDTDAAKIVAIDNRSSDKAYQDEAELAELLGAIAVDDPTLLGTGYDMADLEDLYMKLEPPDLAALTAEHGAAKPSDVWPTLRVQMPRTLLNQTLALMASYEGEPHQQWEQIIDAATP